MTDHPGSYPQQAYPGYPPPHQQGYPAYPPAGYDAYAPQAAAPWPQQYEFSEVENKTIERCAAWSKALAVLSYFLAGLNFLSLNLFGLIGMLAYIGVGIAFWRAGKSLAAVVETEGNDVKHLMEALKMLSVAFLIRLICALAAVIIALLIGVIAALIVLARASG